MPSLPCHLHQSSFAALRLLATGFTTCLIAPTSMTSGVSILLCFRMLRAACACLFGIETLFGLFFNDLYDQLQSQCPSAGNECRSARIPGLFYADDVALLSASASGLQQLLDSMQSFCVTNGLTISIHKTEVVVFGGGHFPCTWTVAGQDLKRSLSFTYLGMLFHEDVHIRHAIHAHFNKACAAVGSICSRYCNLQCAHSVRLLIRLQSAILQPCASYGCEVWAPAAASVIPLWTLQHLQHSFLRRACRVKKSVPIQIVVEELSAMR